MEEQRSKRQRQQQKMYQHPHSNICSIQRLYNVFKLFVGCIQDIDRKKMTFLYIYMKMFET